MKGLWRKTARMHGQFYQDIDDYRGRIRQAIRLPKPTPEIAAIQKQRGNGCH